MTKKQGKTFWIEAGIAAAWLLLVAGFTYGALEEPEIRSELARTKTKTTKQIAQATSKKTKSRADRNRSLLEGRIAFEVPIGDSPVRGAENPTVTIVEFSDFQ
ncbi:MAG: hypothetical protein D6795_07835 [Deltaproteobacteria bacterium]|nr:MAG: hypothetical protein D6795_07835 [Deltaproteobacteria bacterium]